MRNVDRQTRSRLMQLLAEHNINPRNYLGQNFLIDLNLVEYIASQAELDEYDVAFEVGAGTGSLTSFLAEKAGVVVSVEVDPAMYRLAREAIEPYDNVTLLNCDVLRNKNNFSDEVLAAVRTALGAAPGRRLKLVSNLPYSIATPVVSNLVATELRWELMVVTIQLELAQRMTAEPGGGDYGALSVWLQSQCRINLLKKLPPAVFWPRPKVSSAILRLLPDKRGQATIEDRPFLQDFLRRVFHHRRKLLRRVLLGMYRKELNKADIDTLLHSMDLPKQARAEQLGVSMLVAMSNRLWRAIQEKSVPAATGIVDSRAAPPNE